MSVTTIIAASGVAQLEPPTPTESVLLDIAVIAALLAAIVVGLVVLRNRRR